MRIDRIRVDAFGRLRRLDTGPGSLGDLVVVLGPNEAGKSTLFGFLTTALYGFHPASRDRNPHVPWGADEAAGSVVLSVDGGRCVEVERRLRSAPSGRMTGAGVTRDLRNLPLPWVEHVPRTVFRQVFAVTLADLAGLDDETWARIQDRIVGSMGSSDLRPARSVVDELEREAAEIWRPNRRGNQRLRALQEEMRALRARRTTALERDREIRALVEEREDVRARLRELREERHTHRQAIERVQSLLPLRRQLARIDALRERGGPREELRGLPAEPRAALAELRAEQERSRRRLDALVEELSEPEAAIGRFDASVRDVLDREPQIRRFLATAAEVGAERRRSREGEARLSEIAVQLETAGEHLLAGAWRGELADAVAAVSVPLVRDRVERLRAASAKRAAMHGSVQARRTATERGGSAVTTPVAVASLLLGLALLTWGLTGGLAAPTVAGAALATAGALVLASRLRASERPAPAAADGDADRAPARLTAEVAHMLLGIPLRSDYLDPPGDPLVSGLERLQTLIGERGACLRSLDEAGRRIAEADEAARTLASSLGRNGSPDAETFAATIDRELREAEHVRERAAVAERERARMLRAREEGERDVARVAARIEGLVRIVGPLGAGDADRGAEVAEARLREHARADQLTEELERNHPDLPEQRARIRELERTGEAWALDDAELARTKAHLEELDGIIEEMIARAEKLDRDAAHLREQETVDAVDGEAASLQEKESDLVRERDRKWVMAHLVREADRRFRDEHQPDLLRRASTHLEHLTGGRYDRLLVDETRPDGLFQIVGPDLPAPVRLAAPVSTGTLEQAYLGLRLAIVDHLDQGHERLPLFIDEAFVNWDRERRNRGLDVLVDLASGRQLFVFTCHPDMADRLEERGARLLRLERDP